MSRKEVAGLQIDENLFDFIEKEVLLHHPSVKSADFWKGFSQLIEEFGAKNAELLAERARLQSQLDVWNKHNRGKPINTKDYIDFLQSIGYLVPQPADFKISTENVDIEIAEQAGPQLVVPIGNARYALNAANARWGSLYDALYGTDVIDQSGELAPGTSYNEKRGARVIAYTKTMLDKFLPLAEGSHSEVRSYQVRRGNLVAHLDDGKVTVLKDASLFAGYCGTEEEPTSLLFKHHGLHLDILIDKESSVGKTDRAGVKDVILEAAITTIMDFEDSTAAVDGADKTQIYRNWLGLLTGSLTEAVTKGGRTFTRKLNPDREYLSKEGKPIRLKGRSLLFLRHVGLLMRTPAVLDAKGEEVFEGLVDGVITGLLAPYGITNCVHKNSEKGSIYVVKPKLHGPEEAQFTNELFSAIEDLTHLPRYSLKLGLMDEERRTTLNLKACIEKVKNRIVFINTGFLDRTGDEIHTSTQLGVMVRKEAMKKEAWLAAYELNNVEVGLRCGLMGRAQIGKGMWARPDDMAALLKEKINHPKAGATTAWVPSPTAATLHALHYHELSVAAVQQEILKRQPKDYLEELLKVPLAVEEGWTNEEIQEELENNCQGILGYVVRWIDQGIGCSKVPDIHNVALMEDRATCRISSQHIANWLLHGVINSEQVEAALRKMAAVVDKQNSTDKNYHPMVGSFDISCAFLAAKDLIFKGLQQPSGYTEPLLHAWRLKQKALSS
ncbi:MAG: malate synthase G [Neisseriaceae bacterium]